jgi:hypothetical protein
MREIIRRFILREIVPYNMNDVVDDIEYLIERFLELNRELKKDETNIEPQPEGNRNPHTVMFRRLGGLKGGTARARALTAKQRPEIATRAARKRWPKK